MVLRSAGRTPATCGEDEQIDEIEDRLIRRARAGDAEAYGELARRHERAALRVATVVLGTAEGSDDVVQTALERGWRSMDRFEPGRPFRPWVLQIVANTARNDRRGRGRRARLAVRAASVAGVDTSSGAATPDERAVTDADAIPEAAGRATPTLGRWRDPRPWLGAAAVALVFLIAGAVVAPVREAVADWLGIGSTRIETGSADDRLADLPELRAGLSPVDPGEAAAILGRSLPEVRDPRLGEPATLVGPPSEGGVVLAWEPGATSLWIRSDEPIRPDRAKRGVDAGAIEWIDDLGDGAVLVAGDHVLETPVRRVAASSALLWTDDGVEYRLESDLDRDTMLAIARSIVP